MSPAPAMHTKHRRADYVAIRALWAAGYAVLLLLPLAFAAMLEPAPGPRPFVVEAAVAVGFIGYALMATQFALVTRLEGLMAPIGVDARTQLHRLMGLATCTFLLIHALPLLWEGSRDVVIHPFTTKWENAAGAAGFWLVLIMSATSLWRRRMRLRYETWRGIHATGAVLAVTFSVIHVLGVSSYAAAVSLAALVVGYAGSAGALWLWHRLLRPALLLRRPWRVAEVHEESAATRTFTVVPEHHPGFTFQPGQFVYLSLRQRPFAGWHPITISSSAGAELSRLELSIKALGDWSGDEVPRIVAGDRVWIDGPYGGFVYDGLPAGRTGLLLIAGGIGITPMRSMLLTLRDRMDPVPVQLIQAARRVEGLLFRDELHALQTQIPLTIHEVLEEPPPQWPGEVGRVTEALLRRVMADNAQPLCYLCGPGPMLDEIEERLMTLGVAERNILTERYFTT